MENYLISPEDCLILRAFKNAKSLREAAQLLNCDPAGLTRKVHQISSQHGLIQKVDNRWRLTSRGLEIVSWAEASILSQRQIFNDRGQCRIASTMWLGEMLLIPRLKKLMELYENKTSFSFHVPNESFERFLLEGSAEFAIVCHAPETPEIEHRRIFEEEWVVILPKSYDIKSIKTFKDLSKKTFIKHGLLNTDLLIPGLLEIPSANTIVIDNIIGIRSAVLAGLGWSIVPKISVKKHIEDSLIRVFPYEINTADRHVCLWWLRHNLEAKKMATKIQQWLKSN